MSDPHVAFRAHQLDALRLDADATGVLTAGVLNALRAWRVSAPPEAVEAFVRALVLAPIAFTGASAGMRYLNLRYAVVDVDAVDTSHRGRLGRARMWAAYAAAVLLPALRAYAGSRLRAALHIAAALHLLRFVRTGVRRGWPERIAGLHVAYGPGGAERVPLELLDRQHVWRGLAAGALVFAPLLRALPVPRLFSLVGRAARNPSANVACPACGDALNDIRMPHRALPCGCAFCYMCVAQPLEAGAYRCPRHGEPIVDVVRLIPTSSNAS